MSKMPALYRKERGLGKIMFQRAELEQLNQYFLPLSDRPSQCVYFVRISGVSPEIVAFIRQYYEETRKNGVLIDGRIPNPDPKQLAYFSEIMGASFQMDQPFLNQSLSRWLPRMTPAQRERVAGAMFSTLKDLAGQGKNENMLRNAYIKYMCWLYYKFERVLNQLGGESLPKILYDGAVSSYELQLLTILSRAGADIVLLDRGGETAYGKLDPAGAWSQPYQGAGLAAFPDGFHLKQIQEEIDREQNRQRLYGPLPSVGPCTNAWMSKPELGQILTPVGNRGTEERFFYNAFLAQYGVEDKLTFSGDLFALWQRLKSEGRQVCVVNGNIAPPTPEEVALIQRKNYTSMEALIAGLSQNLRSSLNTELQRLMVKAFVDTLLEDGQEVPIPKLTNWAVYLLCWLKRYQKELFDRWSLPKVSVFILFGQCSAGHEARFLRLLARLPVDVVLLQPNLNSGSSLRDPALLELRYENSLAMDSFPVEQAHVRVSTAAYQAERDLDTLMYRDSGLYRNQQYGKAETVTLKTMYEEISLLWEQDLKYRPSFQVLDDTVTVPVLLEKICGVRDGWKEQYWLDIKKLLTPDTLLVPRIPWIDSREANPMKACATQFLRSGRLLKNKIKEHKSYPYGILRAEMQDHLLDKLQILLDRRIIAGVYENGTEYTVIAVALNLNRELLRMIQKFDFTKKNPKLVIINTTEEVLSLEDSILVAYLNLVGFDILFFVPTGYQCIERHFRQPFANEQQIGEYLYDLSPPDFSTLRERNRNPIRKLFGRSH